MKKNSLAGPRTRVPTRLLKYVDRDRMCQSYRQRTYLEVVDDFISEPDTDIITVASVSDA